MRKVQTSEFSLNWRLQSSEFSLKWEKFSLNWRLQSSDIYLQMRSSSPIPVFSPSWCREKGVGALEGEGRMKKGEGRELEREN
jgi:hypothetical protein